jgi:predicted nucleic acid-binding protein/predicted CopG family antitoxin
MEITSVALDREAYDLLRGQKRPGESFSQVVKRLAKNRRPLASFVGAWKDLPEKTLRQIQAERKHLWALDEQRFDRLMKGGRWMVRALDTSFLIDVLRGHRGAAAKAEVLDSEAEVITIPAPVLAEFLDGAYFAGGTYLTKAMQLVGGRDVVPFDKECSLIAGQLRTSLRGRGESLPMIDAMIASTVLRHHSILVTGDTGFTRIPGLAVESY